jgi:hypothetical protein
LKRSASDCVNNISTCSFSTPDIPLDIGNLPKRRERVEGQADFDLTGIWQDDQPTKGRYYIRQDGRNIWWYGEQLGVNPIWSNVFNGRVYGNNIIIGDWADVPEGVGTGKGKLTLNVASSHDSFTLSNSVGTPYRANRWTPAVS